MEAEGFVMCDFIVYCFDVGEYVAYAGAVVFLVYLGAVILGEHSK